MPVIQVNDKQYTLKPGQTRLGSGAGVDVQTSQDANLGVQAVLELDPQNRVVIRRAREGAAVRVNGVTLVDPTPLMHGDKVDVAGTEVLFSDDKKVGATQFVSASDIAGIAAKRSGPARATAATGGRLVSLVDGKEYQIPAAGITFGREAGSDVVVAQAEVSRRHAVIAPAEGGYVLTDHSTNGVWLNGNRVQGSQLLSRADVVRVGSEEFRFYADVAAATPSAKPTPVVTPAAPPAASSQPVPPTPEPTLRVPPMPPPATASPSPAPASRQEPPTVPAAIAPAPAAPAAPSPAVTAAPAPAPLKPPAPARPAPRKEPITAPAAMKDNRASGGVPAWIWIVLIVIVAAAAYYLGQQGRG